MKRIDVHNHFLPGLDDGCRNLDESLTCLKLLVENGYTRAFCTPHTGETGFDITTATVAKGVAALQAEATKAGIPIELKPGGEIRISPGMIESLTRLGVPSFAHAGKYALADIWCDEWPAWATRAVEWIQKRGLTLIMAHPERLGLLRKKPEYIDELTRMGLLFQGNLGPIGGADSADVVALGERYLKDGRYFLLGSDGHKPDSMGQRIDGLKRIEQLIGGPALSVLLETNPATLWH